MSEERRKVFLAAGLLGILAVVLVWRLAPVGGGGGGGGGVSGLVRGDGGQVPPALVEEIVDVHFAELELKPGQFTPGRDPFRFYEPPRPRPERRPPVARTAPRRPRPPANAEATPAAAAKPQPPDVDFVYLGSFGPNERPIGVFSDSTDIYNVRSGDVFKEHFVVDKIGYESADIKFVGFPDAPAERLAIGG